MDRFLIKFLEYIEKETHFFEDKDVTVKQVVNEYWSKLHIQEVPDADHILFELANNNLYKSWDEIPDFIQLKLLPEVMIECFKYAWARGYNEGINDGIYK